jgi:hypothetical protein
MLFKSESSKGKQPLSSALGWCLLPELPCSWVVRASPAVLSMWFHRAKSVEEKSKCAGLAQENSFGSA